jgi:hypothetical protein
MPLIALGKWYPPWILNQELSMAEPVMNLELQPGGNKRIYTAGRYQPVPGEQFFADYAWAGLK